MNLYGRPMANVQNWMKKLAKGGYLEQVKREVRREPGKRPKGDTGYQLVASRIVDELDRTLAQNTSGALTFNTDEKSALVDLIDSREARNLVAGLVSPTIRQAKAYDLCSMLSTILWTRANIPLKERAIDTGYSNLLVKYVKDPRFGAAISRIARRLPKASGISLSQYAETRFAQRETLASLIFFGLRFHNFMANCSPTFVEKLRWCLVPTQPLAYTFSKISRELPEIVQDVTEAFEAGDGDQK